MLVEFTRTVEHEDEDGLPVPLPITIQAQAVGAIFPHAEHPNVTVIRLMDGRGFSIREPYPEVVAKVAAALQQSTPTTSKKQKRLPAPSDSVAEAAPVSDQIIA